MHRLFSLFSAQIFPPYLKKNNKKAGTIPIKQNSPAKTIGYGRQCKYNNTLFA